MKRSAGYIDKYDANPRASMAFRLFPVTALEKEYRIPVVVNTPVDRPRHVATVNGLNKNLAALEALNTKYTETTKVPCRD